MLKKSSPYILICVLPFLLHAPIWLGCTDFFSGDGSDLIPYFYASKLLQHHTWQTCGEIPLWNPYFFFGQPAVGNIQNALFYPLNLLFMLVSFFNALWVYQVLHMVSAGLGMYCLARYTGAKASGSLLAACLFMLNGRLLAYINAGWLSYFGALCWLPFLVLATLAVLREDDSLYAVLLAVVLSMCFLAGTPQYALFGICLIILQWLCHLGRGQTAKERLESTYRCLLGGLLFFFLISVQLLPSLELTGLSFRAFVSGPSQGFHFEWDPGQWFRTFFRPELLRHDYAWELCAYIGIGGLALSIPGLVAARRHLSLAVIWGLLPFLGSLGAAFPFGAALMELIPGLALLTIPSRFLIFSILILCLFAGHGLDCVIQAIRGGAKHVWLYLGGAGIGLAVCGAIIPLQDQATITAAVHFWISLGLSGLFFGLFAWRRTAVFQFLLMVWLIIDPLWLAFDLLRDKHHQNSWQHPTHIVDALQDHAGPVRVATIQPEHLRHDLLNPFDDWLSPAYGIRRAGGYEPLATLSSLRFLTRMDGTGDIQAAMWGFRPWSFARPGLYDLAGITHLITSQPWEHPRLQFITRDAVTMPHFRGGWWKNQPMYLYANKGVLPRAFFKARNSYEAVTAIAIGTPSPNHLHLHFKTEKEGIVVVSESYHDGWVGRDGKGAPVALQPFIGTFLSFSVAPGEHDVFLNFTPQSYLTGRRLTLAGLLLGGLLIVFRRKRTASS